MTESEPPWALASPSDGSRWLWTTCRALAVGAGIALVLSGRLPSGVVEQSRVEGKISQRSVSNPTWCWEGKAGYFLSSTVKKNDAKNEWHMHNNSRSYRTACIIDVETTLLKTVVTNPRIGVRVSVHCFARPDAEKMKEAP